MEKEKKRKSKDAKAASETLAVVAEKAKEPEAGAEKPAVEEEPVAGPAPPPPEESQVEEGEEDEEEQLVEDEEEEEEGEEEGNEEEAPVVGLKPPVLGQIPHVASYTADAKLRSEPEDVERVSPGFIPISEMTPINASQVDFPINTSKEPTFEPETTEDNQLDKYVTAGSEEQPAVGSKAEEIAQRVFASPVEDGTLTAEEEIPKDIKESADTTANTEASPVVNAESEIVPASVPTAIGAETGKAVAEPRKATEESTKYEVEPSKPSGTLFPATKTTTETSQPEKPVADRIAPPVAASAPATAPTSVSASAATEATTKTTVSGPSKPSKEKDSGKVSGWLKSKFSRRSSKPTKPEPAASSSSSKLTKTAPANDKTKDVVSVTGPAGTTVQTEAKGANSSDLGDSSMREVAMAGREKDDTTAAAPTPPVVSPLRDDGPVTATGTTAQQERESSEISSLSSDEDTRGRSTVRLADSLGLPTNEPEGHTSEAHQQPTNKRAGMVVPDMHSSIGKSSTSGGEFEEANDAFDSDGLSPPPAVLPGAEEGRTSSSPARDSRFVEVL